MRNSSAAEGNAEETSEADTVKEGTGASIESIFDGEFTVT